MTKHGFFWHVHHDVLLEYCYDYDERVRYIQRWKPWLEVKERLRLFQPVKGKLPAEVIRTGKACGKAGKAYDKAWEVCAKAGACGKAYDGSCGKTYDNARKDYKRVMITYCDALNTHRPAIEKLHDKECQNCLWDGKKLVFGQMKHI